MNPEKKLSIFIIDDDKFLLDTYALKFTKSGYAVTYAFSGDEALKKLQQVAIANDNLFAELMETVKHCSLGQITHALYEVGGQYRRNM